MTRRTNNSAISMPARRWCELVVFVAGCLAFGYILSSCSKPDQKVENSPPPPANTSDNSIIPVINPDADFSNFQHSNPAHARFPCALCHERAENSATPKLPGHVPCASCHVSQFADHKSAICTICHTNPAESAETKGFPTLKSFTAAFDHARHSAQTNCATCHKPARNGVALSIPAGVSAHNSCFQCHTPDARSGEKNIGSCDACHQPGNGVVRISERARTYEETPFSHASHRMNCSACHNLKADASRGNQVTAPIAAMHFARKGAFSCASCHNNKRAFGGDDFADCKRCHQGNGFKF